MPSGPVHHKIWKRSWPLAVILALFAWYWWGYFSLFISCLVGYFIGRWLDPDLDLLGLSEAEGRMMRELKIVGVVLVMWFFPYAYFMRFIGIGRKGHRNFFSHFPLIGTAVRMAWVICPILAVLWFGFHINLIREPLAQISLLGAFSGLALADGEHYLADLLHKEKA